jgi:hypothetical protein
LFLLVETRRRIEPSITTLIIVNAVEPITRMIVPTRIGTGDCSMTEQQAQGIAEIEATQKALRESIETTKGLAEKTEALIQKHKDTLTQGQS